MKIFVRVTLSFVIVQYTPLLGFTDWVSFALAVGVYTLSVVLVEPVLRVVSLPLSIVTFGLFRLVIALCSLWLALFLVPGATLTPVLLFGVQLGYFGTMVLTSVLLRLLQRMIAMVF
ncbi:MAG: phage holin family protein [Pseudomonadales bacterium]|nr:phage holin family protein [Candidatus Woesebacteria bacterium]MCB9802384.1 phage holin family protein [Pseudomonadales bacterium]